MNKENLSQETYAKILETFMQTLMKKGLKATTMDSMAATLHISKRSLYEIFGNKEEMFREAHKYFHRKVEQDIRKFFLDSSNVMEAIVKCFLYNRDLMSGMNPEFIKDMEELVENSKNLPEDCNKRHYLYLYDVVQKGVSEGFFREDINLKVQCRMLLLQMQALKNTEDLFPKDISLLEIYDSVIIGFLRAISSEKGFNELEKYLPYFPSTKTPGPNQ